jgi:hypothetical protein
VAARRTAVVLVCFVVASVAAVLLATGLGSQRYLLLMPLHTWFARAIVVTFGPLLLGVAWFLTTRGRWTTIVCVATTVLVAAAGLGLGVLWTVYSGLSGEHSVRDSQVFTVSPQGRFELVWELHEFALWPGRSESVLVRTRAGLASRESVEDLMTCRNSSLELWPEPRAVTLASAAELSFVDETSIRVRSGGSTQLVSFDAETLRVDRAVSLQYCPSVSLLNHP